MEATINRTKTLDDYMNDPDIIDEPMGLREIHAIRFMIQDEEKNMTPEEMRERRRRTLEEFGIKTITKAELQARLERSKIRKIVKMLEEVIEDHRRTLEAIGLKTITDDENIVETLTAAQRNLNTILQQKTSARVNLAT